MVRTRSVRLTVDEETASALEDALSYYLLMSKDNFGSGYDGEDADTLRQFLHERDLVEEFFGRVTYARLQMAAQH